MKKLRLNIGGKASSYDICIGNGIEEKIALTIAKEFPAQSMALITDDNVAAIHGERFLNLLRSAGLDVHFISFPAGEASKNIGVVLKIVERLLDFGVERSAKVIALGGGVVGDVASFVASIYMRGIPHIQVPTTVIAQTDSSIGGKTGVDLPRGKNLVGTFSQPSAVFIDTNFLQTLSEKDFIDGMAEAVKYSLIEDENMLAFIEDNTDKIMRRDMDTLKALVENCCRIKKGIVEIDEKEKGIRKILNFGHTIGHALEAASDYRMPHGEAVAVGMLAALEISHRRYQMPDEVCERMKNVLLALGLPVKIPSEIDIDSVLVSLHADKKKDGGKINFVLLKNIGLPFINGGVPQDLLLDILGGMRE